MTTTFAGSRHHLAGPAAAGAEDVARAKTWSLSLSTIGLVALIVSAWSGIAPFVGPVFGYDPTGNDSWHWTLAHGVLAVAPGAAGCLMGLWIMGRVPVTRIGRRRFGLSAAGLVAVASGAWFAIGPLAWPVLSNQARYFLPASPLHNLANVVGCSIGPGIILAACGAFAMGWAARHNSPLPAGAAAVGTAPAGAEAATAPPAETPTVRPVAGPGPGQAAEEDAASEHVAGEHVAGAHVTDPSVEETRVSDSRL